MQSWEKTLTRQFTEQIDKQHKETESANSLLNVGEQEIADWPRIKGTISEEVIPTLEDWLVELRKQTPTQPASLCSLRREKRRTERFAKAFWFRPQAVCVRLQVPTLRIKIARRRAFLKMLAFFNTLSAWGRLLYDWLREDMTVDSGPDDTTDSANGTNGRMDGRMG